MEVAQESPILYEVRLVKAGQVHSLAAAKSLGQATDLAELWLSDQQQACPLNERGQRWRSEPATPAQVDYCHKLTGRAVSELSLLPKGKVSDLISLGKILSRPQMVCGT